MLINSAKEKKLRLFVAIMLNEEAKDSLARLQHEVMRGLRGLSRKIPEEKLHVTLSFLGQKKEEAVPELIDRLTKVPIKQFALLFSAIEYVGRRNRGDLIWVKSMESLPLSELKRAIDDSFGLCGREKAGLLTAHITLFRLKHHKKAAIKDFVSTMKVAPIVVAVNAFSLMQSITTDAGTHYLELQRFAATC